MKHLRVLILFTLLSLTMLAAFRASEQSCLRYGSVSLRYHQPLPSEAVAAAKSQMEKTGSVDLTFWTEKKCIAASALRTAEAAQILFDGEAMLACPAEYCFGRTPVSVGECAVSSTLTDVLFGAENVIGLELTDSERTYTVTGVFREDHAILLTPGEEAWTAAELHSIPPGADDWRYGRDYAMQLGFPQPDQVLWGSGFAWISSVLPWLPLIVCGCRVLFFCLCLLWKRSHTVFCLTMTGFAFTIVLTLPLFLSFLPAWLIPTRWSNFSFWSDLTDSLVLRFRESLSLSPQILDVSGKLYVLKTLFYSIASLALLGGLFKRIIPTQRD